MPININDELPIDKIAQIRRFARDLTWMHINGEIKNLIVRKGRLLIPDYQESLEAYISVVWGDKYPNIELLRAMRYMEYIHKSPIHNESEIWVPTEKAISLLDDITVSTIFISYSRAESSALALLLVARLKEYGLSAFLDMHPDREGLAVGDKWHAKLEDLVAANDNFIVLIGQQSLNSPYVRQEIEWARKYNKAIYPVWHNGFKGLNQNVSYEVTEAIKYVVETVNATIVEAENPKQYNAALDELLSSFGIVP